MLCCVIWHDMTHAIHVDLRTKTNCAISLCFQLLPISGPRQSSTTWWWRGPLARWPVLKSAAIDSKPPMFHLPHSDTGGICGCRPSYCNGSSTICLWLTDACLNHSLAIVLNFWQQTDCWSLQFHLRRHCFNSFTDTLERVFNRVQQNQMRTCLGHLRSDSEDDDPETVRRLCVAVRRLAKGQ